MEYGSVGVVGPHSPQYSVRDFEQRFHVKLHAIKHRLARCKTRLAMLGANKAQAGEGWLEIKPSPDGRRPRACFFYPWRVSSRQVGATRAGELAAEPSPVAALRRVDVRWL